MDGVNGCMYDVDDVYIWLVRMYVCVCMYGCRDAEMKAREEFNKKKQDEHKAQVGR